MRDRYDNIRYITPFPATERIDYVGLSPEKTSELIMKDLRLDGNPELNYASQCNPIMETMGTDVFVQNLNKNLIEKPIYRETIEMSRRCISMLLSLFNAKPCNDPTGVVTVSSTEAILLAGLNYRTRWEQKNPCKACPKIIFASNAAVSWRKFANFFEVEPIIIPVNKDNKIDIEKVKRCLNEDVICVVGTLGNTYTGSYDDIAYLNRIVDEYNRYNEWKIPIHVDAASGGMIAPFYPPYGDICFDFNLKWVRSINVSGSEYGYVYPGVGFALWKSREEIASELIYEFDYYGSPQQNFTLNFTKSAANIIGQYYVFNRYGKDGLCKQAEYLFEVTKYLCDKLLKIEICGERVFEKVNNYPGNPMLILKVKELFRCQISLKELTEILREYGWLAASYNLTEPNEDVEIIKFVQKMGFNLAMAEQLAADVERIIFRLARPYGI